MTFRHFLTCFPYHFVRSHSELLVGLFYGSDFWTLREHYRSLLAKSRKSGKPSLTLRLKLKLCDWIYTGYLHRYNAFIPIYADIASPPILPHGIYGIFISNSAKIGKGVIIYQQVTIGSNMLPDSSRRGAPTIEDGVLIGCGARIIGSCTIGHHSRIAAGCSVSKDCQPNSVIYPLSNTVIKENLNNVYIPNTERQS